MSAMLVLTLNCFSQKLVITKDGFRDSSNLNNGYVVINVDGKTAKQLFDNAIVFVNKAYKNPDKVITGKIDTTSLAINGYADILIKITTMPNGKPRKKEISTILCSTYNIQLSFKNNKVKFEIIDIDFYWNTYNGKENLYFQGTKGLYGATGIYDADGNLKLLDYKACIENYFNGYIQSLMIVLAGKSNVDSW